MSILQICAYIGTVGAAIGVPAAWLLSFSKMTKRFQDLERHTQENYSTNKILCRGMLHLLRHARTGNDVDNIQDVENELVKFLAEK